jgi:GrpB-like predicted nucleotidyltransferase (UPF0157 family)
MKTIVILLIGTIVGVIILISFNSRIKKTIEIIPYNSQWPQLYESEAAPIKKTLGSNCLAIHHFGSTSIVGLSAKPKIDILAVVKNFSSIDIPALKLIGYEYRGEVIPSGRYFVKENPKIHLHIFEEDNPWVEHNLIFRDWLRTHDADRDAYAKLKQDLANQHTDGMKYNRAKTEFINKIVKKAINEKEKEVMSNAK